MKASPTREFLVTREAGFCCGEDVEHGNPTEGRETTSLRDWVVVASTHAEAISLAGGPTLASGERKYEIRHENGYYESWEALTLKVLARREGDIPSARVMFKNAMANPGSEVI
ncbi:MAG: hypothetical protein IPF72_20170 [Chitinophagaceae bacterium]|nr:hypothetical protein [Chitinophagaceae bacterium]